VGVTSIKPDPGEETPDVKTMGMAAALWIAASALIALFTGGWMAARFAGLPDTTDGVLHGLMVWGVTMLISSILMFSAMGRLLSGMGYILGESLRLMTDAASAAVSGMSAVAGGAASVAASAAGTAARGMTDAGRKVADEAGMPDMSEATNTLERAREQLMGEVRQYMRDAGIMPEKASQTAQQTADDIRNTAANAVRNPDDAQRQINALLDRIFVSGENVVSDVDRNTLVNLLATRGNMTQEEAMRSVMRWEDTYGQARNEFMRRREEARSMAQSVKTRAQAEIRDVKEQVEDVKDEVQYRARRAAQTTAEAIAGAAAVIAAALIISGIAAGIGGSLGTPDHVETVDVQTNSLPGG
jgi:ElaB/YqjD/DUF883 family membrane-anchored ribosome-binding protein